jgi:hypothetical protein
MAMPVGSILMGRKADGSGTGAIQKPREIDYMNREPAGVLNATASRRVRPHRLTRPNLPDRPAFPLSLAAASRYDQRLAEGMRMPGGARTRVESNTSASTNAGSRARNRRSIRTAPVNHSGGPWAVAQNGAHRAGVIPRSSSPLAAQNDAPLCALTAPVSLLVRFLLLIYNWAHAGDSG